MLIDTPNLANMYRRGSAGVCVCVLVLVVYTLTLSPQTEGGCIRQGGQLNEAVD